MKLDIIFLLIHAYVITLLKYRFYLLLFYLVAGEWHLSKYFLEINIDLSANIIQIILGLISYHFPFNQTMLNIGEC